MPSYYTNQPGIYAIVCLCNHKVYIGSAVNISKRWGNHRHDLGKGNHHSIHLQRAWDKYGEKSFEFEVLEHIDDKDTLLIKEQYWIDHFSSYLRSHGFNIWHNARSGLGVKRSEEHKKKLSDAHRGVKLSEKHRKNIGLSHAGEKSHHATITDNQARDIKQLLANGSVQYQVARDHGLSKQIVHRIKSGKSWSNILIDTPIPESHTRGSRHPNSILNENSVLVIRTRINSGDTCGSIASDFGVNTRTILDIKNRKTWNHVQ